MKSVQDLEFITKLQQEAQLQAKLEKTRFLPQELDALTAFVGRHPWQVILVVSGATSLLLEFLKVAL